ncbi:Vacuolar protein sorting-associated protein 13 [Coemansia sp. RSA 376]|nr:Vacuolar protein sorting-associated protein 13 [Coemansia sp. RSA 376]
MFEGVVATLLNRFLGNYVTNLETTQLKLGIWQGDVKLEKLRLKKDALDKLRLPVDIKEGWLGTLTISIPWSNLKGEPVRITIDNVYVLAAPRFQGDFDPEREHEREYKRKMRRLENDDLLRQQQVLKTQGADGEDAKKQASFTEQLIAKIVDNLQIVIKNIHVRYEDGVSNPEHLFAVGATLGELSAVSTDDEWRQAFLHDSGSVIRKMLKLAQFSMYWDTDCQTMQGLDHQTLIRSFAEAIGGTGHQSILQPVVGMGRLAMNKRPAPEDVRTTAKFEFDQLAFELDNEQYADALLLTTAFDYAMRQRRYCKHHPPPGVRPKDDPRAWLMFALRSVYDEVHDHHYRKTWEFQKERRDDRLLYIRVYSALKVNHGVLTEADRMALDYLHRKLSYQDIRFYRARAEPTIRRQMYLIRKRKSELDLSAAAGKNDASAPAAAGITGWVGGWVSSWVTGTPQRPSTTTPPPAGDDSAEVEGFADSGTQLSSEQVQELYDTIEFNEDEANDAEYDLPKETIKLSASAVLRSGSLRLKVDRKTRDHTLMGFLFDMLRVDLLVRPQNLVTDVSMHRFEVVDGTLPGTQYPRMIYVQNDVPEERMQAVADAPGGLASLLDSAMESPLPDNQMLEDPFLHVHFEKDPLDGHADSVVNVKVKSLNVIYHPTAARAIIDFFEPPSSASAESMHALIAAASKSMAGFRDQTRAGLEYALSKHKTVDVKVDFDAPVIVIPQDVLDPHSEVVVLDTGYLTIESQLVDVQTTERIRQKQSQVLSAEEMRKLEGLMYDHFDMRLHRTQLLVGNDLAACMQALEGDEAHRGMHVVDRIELNFDLGLCILSEPPLHMPKVTVDGGLPSLQVYFSDRKYKAIMRSIDLILEAIKDEDVDIAQQYEAGGRPPATAFGAGGIFQRTEPDSSESPDTAMMLENVDRNSDAESVDEFYETTAEPSEGWGLRRKNNRDARTNVGKEPDRVLVKVNFAVDNLVGFIWRTHTDGREDLHIADIAVTGLAVECINRPFDLFADVTIHQVTAEDHLLGTGGQRVYALTSDIAQADAEGETGKNLVVVKYHRCQADHPEFTTTYESIGQTVDVDISYLDLMVVRKTILTSYDYILKTFTDESNNAQASKKDTTKEQKSPDTVASLIQEALDTIRVDVRFKGTDFGLCHDDGTPIALLSVTAATMRILVTDLILVEAKIGSLTLSDQLDLAPTDHYRGEPLDPRRRLLFIKGDELADFRYETFDPQAASYPGHNAAIRLRVGAAHLAFIERAISELMEFGSRFSAMYGVFEAARAATAFGTTQLTAEMMGGGQKYHFDVEMSAPVITFPRDGYMPYASHGGGSVDLLVAQPGELTISNEFTTVREVGRDWDVNHVSLALRRIGIKTLFVIDSESSEHGAFGQAEEQVLLMLEDVDYHMDMHLLMQGHVEGCPRPVTELIGALSPIKMRLTEYQYKMVYDLLGVIGRVFGGTDTAPPEDPLIDDRVLDLSVLRENPATQSAQDGRQALANLGQISQAGSVGEQYATIDLFVTLATIQLELFAGSGFGLDSVQRASFTRMDINGLSVKYRAKSNGDSKAELAIMAVRAYDTRPGTENQFTQIISPATPQTDETHGMHAVAQDAPVEEDSPSPQVICHVDMRPQQDMVVLVTLDSPRIILVLDHAFHLWAFATSVFPQQADNTAQVQSTVRDAPADSSTGGLIYKIDVLHPEIILLADPRNRSSEALVLSVKQIILAQEGMFCMTMDEIGVRLCSIDRRTETSRSVMDPFTVIMTMDSRVTPGDIRRGTQSHQATDISVDVGNLLLRVGLNDIMLMLDIFNTAMALTSSPEPPVASAASQFVADLRSGSMPPLVSTPTTQTSVASAPAALDNASSLGDSQAMGASLVKETMRATVAGLRLVVIRDMFGLPVYACTAREFHVDVTDWTNGLRLQSSIQVHASYFNRRNSHWEPFIEPWRCSVNMNQVAGVQKVDINSTDRLLVNASHAVIEESLGLARQWGDEVTKAPSVERMPYVLVNRTGIDCHVWVDLAEGATPHSERIDTAPVLLRDGASLPWRFEDWRRRREQVEAKPHHLGIQFSNGQWEWLRRVQVDREGTRHYTLQPALDDISHRLAVEVRLDAVNLVKRVVLRSPLVVENRTRTDMEVAMCDYRGELRTDSAIIAPGDDLPLPILFCHQYAVRVKTPGYAWSGQYVYWRDFLAQEPRSELCCQAEDGTPFYVHFSATCDARNPTALYKYPFMRLVMTPPMEIENLLPYAMNMRVFDKTSGRRWNCHLPRGGVASVHAVRPGNLVLLSIAIPDAGFDKCDGTIIETPDEDEYPTDTDLVVSDQQGIRLALKIHRMDIPNSGGQCRRISIYAPYVMVNRTGLKLLYSSKGFFKGMSTIAGQHIASGNVPLEPHQANDFERPPPIDDIRPLMFSFGSFDLRNRALVKVPGSDWSRPLSFDALGSSSEVVIPLSDRMNDAHLGLEIEPGRGRYSHTRVVTFTSRYVVKNTTGMALQYRSLYNATQAYVLSDGERQPLHTLLRSRRRLLTIACALTDAQGRPTPSVRDGRWSAPFSIDDVGRMFVRLPTTDGESLIRIDVVLDGACLFVIMQRESQCWPYAIINHTSVDVTVWQHHEKQTEDGTPVEPDRTYVVRAGESLDYAWDSPIAATKLLVVSAMGATRRVSLQEIGEQRPFVYSRPPRRGAVTDHTMNIEVVASGPRQVLRLTGYTPATSLFTPQPRITRTNTQQSTISSTEERFEVVEADEKTHAIYRLGLEGGIGISLINKHSSEILFATLADVELKYSDSTSNQTFKLSVKWIQIDNQIYGALFPIVLYPTTLGVSVAGVSSPPALVAVAVRAKDRSYGVEYFKYASVLAQELSVELDEDFLYALMDFVKFDVPGWNSSNDDTTGMDMLDSAVPEVKPVEDGMQLYFEFLHIQPFKLHMSFMRTQRLEVGGDPTSTRYPVSNSVNVPRSELVGEGVASSSGVVAYAMNILTMAIGNINEAPVSLNALVMQNVRVSMPILLDRMHKHYSAEIFNQVYKLLGSANLLGNPVGLFNNISSGVSDFFYEPYQGFVMSDRPQDFGFGLARGTASLFKKTVYGMTDSFSKFTDSMSKGLSAATMDPRYQTERSMSRVRNKPKHAIYGVARGAESLAKSVTSGLAGVVMRPLEGAEQEGVGGFFKGVGKGLVGVVTKPVIGMFDLASNVTEGIRNTTTVFERDLDRQRLPRHIGRDGIITAYSGRDALGQAWMCELNKGAYAYDNYLAHLELPGSDMVVLLTYQRLVMFRRAKPDEAGMAVGAAGSSMETGSATGAIGVSAANASKAQIEWEQEIRSLHSIQLDATGISLKLPATPEGYMPPGPFIPISDAQSRRWFYDQIKEAVKALIDHRKELG